MVFLGPLSLSLLFSEWYSFYLSMYLNNFVKLLQLSFAALNNSVNKVSVQLNDYIAWNSASTLTFCMTCCFRKSCISGWGVSDPCKMTGTPLRHGPRQNLSASKPIMFPSAQSYTFCQNWRWLKPRRILGIDTLGWNNRVVLSVGLRNMMIPWTVLLPGILVS